MGQKNRRLPADLLGSDACGVADINANECPGFGCDGVIENGDLKLRRTHFQNVALIILVVIALFVAFRVLTESP